MTESKRPETVERFCARTFARDITKLADDLRHAADDVARHVTQLDRVGNPGIPSYADVASNVQQELMRLLGNTHLGSLTTSAQNADQARTKRIAAEAIAAQIDAKAERMRTGEGATPTGFAMGAVVAEGAIIAREYAAKEG